MNKSIKELAQNIQDCILEENKISYDEIVEYLHKLGYRKTAYTSTTNRAGQREFSVLVKDLSTNEVITDVTTNLFLGVYDDGDSIGVVTRISATTEDVLHALISLKRLTNNTLSSLAENEPMIKAAMLAGVDILGIEYE